MGVAAGYEDVVVQGVGCLIVFQMYDYFINYARTICGWAEVLKKASNKAMRSIPKSC